jgi:hypothetical protein
MVYWSNMRGLKNLLALLAAMLLASPAVRAIASTDLKENYQSIIDRNPFGLKPPPPPATNTAAVEQKAKSDIFLTGIVTVGYPKMPKRAYIETETLEQGKKEPKFYEFQEDQSQDGITVLAIDEKSQTVKIKSEGAETLLSFKTHGRTPPASPPPGAPGAPGTQGAPGQPMHPGSQPLPLPGAPNAAAHAYNNNNPNRPTYSNLSGGSRQIPSRSVRVRTPGATMNTGASSGTPGSAPGVTEQPQGGIPRSSISASRPKRCGTTNWGFRHLPFPISSKGLPQKRFVQTAVHGNDLAGGFAQALGHQQEKRLRLVRRRDRLFRQSPVRVKLRELSRQGV